MKKRWTGFLTAIGLTGALTLFNPSVPRDDKTSDEGRQPVKTEKPAPERGKVKTPLRTVNYYTDTLYQKTGALMYYKADKIYRNYVDNNNSYRMQMQFFVHEDWHKHNYYGEFRYKYDYSPLEYYKLCMHDEISANLAAILTLRYEYLSSPDKAAVIAKYEKSYAGFYFKAIKEGIINPESTSPEDNEQEWKLLANETKNMWTRLFIEHYTPATLKMLNIYIQTKGFLPAHPKNYAAMKSYMYKIGGVDFAKYMETDIDCSNKEPLIVEKISKILSFRNEKKDFVEDVLKNVPLLDSLHPNLRGHAMQHILIAAKLKTTVAGEKNPVMVKSLITTQYNKLMFNMSQDFSLNNFIADYTVNELINHPEIQEGRSYRSVIDEIYTFKGVNLNRFISKFSFNRVPQMYNKLLSPSVFPPETSEFFACPRETLPLDSLQFQEPQPPVGHTASRQRLSGELTMTIPNFRDPILTSLEPEQRDTLYQTIQAFENMPSVLKSCNTEKIKEFERKNAEMGVHKYRNGKSHSRG